MMSAPSSIVQITNVRIHLEVALAPTINHYIACHFFPVPQQDVSSLPHGCGAHFMHMTLHHYQEVFVLFDVSTDDLSMYGCSPAMYISDKLSRIYFNLRHLFYDGYKNRLRSHPQSDLKISSTSHAPAQYFTWHFMPSFSPSSAIRFSRPRYRRQRTMSWLLRRTTGQ